VKTRLECGIGEYTLPTRSAVPSSWNRALRAWPCVGRSAVCGIRDISAIGTRRAADTPTKPDSVPYRIPSRVPRGVCGWRAPLRVVCIHTGTGKNETAVGCGPPLARSLQSLHCSWLCSSMAWFGSPRGPPNAASSFTHLISSSLERRFPKKFASAGHTSGLTIGTLREAERGGTAVVVICVDLTEQVLAEAISLHANVIIACSLFPSEPLRSLRVDEPVGRIVLRCAQQSIAAHCLSSACANAPGGVADWLAKSIASGATRPIVPHAECAEAGEGRLLECNEAISLSAIIARLKDILGVRHLRISLGAVVDELNIAKASDSCFIKSIAVHIGEGGELLHHLMRQPGAAFSGVFLSGEMPHADLLAASAKGIIVVLAGQSTVERAFLRQLRQDLQAEFTDADWNVKIKCSETDCHTLTVV